MKRTTKPRRPTIASRHDRHDLYQRSVQSVDLEIDFIDDTFKKLRGRLPRSIREDFCGTANTSCEFVRRRRGNRAWGVDLDADTLAWGIGHNIARLRPEARGRVELVRGDVRVAATPRVDAVLAMNFSYFVFKERAVLRSYFRHARAMLKPGGVFFLDAYGGSDAFRRLRESRRMARGITYVWHQADYDPISGHTTCHIHFRFKDGSRLRNAFTYDWRVWTLPEIREVLVEAGFRRVTVYWEGWDEKEWEGNGEFKPAKRGDPDLGWIVYVVAEG